MSTGTLNEVRKTVGGLNTRLALPGRRRSIRTPQRCLETCQGLSRSARRTERALQLRPNVLQLLGTTLESVAGLFQFVSELTELESKESDRIAVSSAFDQEVGERGLLLANASGQSFRIRGCIR
jgi:hypothetical protein